MAAAAASARTATPGPAARAAPEVSSYPFILAPLRMTESYRGGAGGRKARRPDERAPRHAFL